MNVRDGHIGYKEWAAFALVTTGAKMLNPSPVILTEYGREAAWLLALTAGAINFALLFVVFRFMRPYPGLGLLDVVEKRSGRLFAKSFAFVLWLGFGANGFLNLRLLVDQAKIVTLPQTPVSVLMAGTLLVSVYLALKGVETLGRVCRILLPWLFAAVFSVAALVANRYSLYNLAPWFGPGVLDIGWEGLRHALYFGESFALPVLALFVRQTKDFEKGLLSGTASAILATTFLVVIMQLVLGSPGSENVTFPFLELTRMIYINRFIQHLEGVYSAIWLLIAFTQIALELYLANFLFAQLFGVKRFRPMLLPTASLFFMLALLPQYFYETILWKDRYLIQLGGLVVYGTFFCAWIAAWFRGVPEEREGAGGGADAPA